MLAFLKKYWRAIFRIFFLGMATIALIWGFQEVGEIWSASRLNEEALSLAKIDLEVAQTYGVFTKRKLRETESKYADLLKRYNSKVSAYAELKARYEYQQSQSSSTASTVPSGNPGIVGDCELEECYALLEGESLFIEYSDFHLKISNRLKRSNGTSWEYDIGYELDQTFSVEVLETENVDTGKKEMLASLYEIDGDGKQIIKLEIEEFRVAYNYEGQEIGMVWWAPNVKLGVHQPLYTSTSWFPAGILGISFSKYVSPKKGELFNFFQVGIGLNPKKDFKFMFTPLSYNIGSHIPLIKDLWVGADLGVNLEGKLSFGISLTTNL